MMRAIAKASVEKSLYTWIVILFALFGGMFGYLNVGKLEDPIFTLKSALVITAYPGATAAQVAMEVSEPIEAEIQQMGEIKTITSRNVPGVSIIEVEVGEQYDGEDLKQIWDDLRDRVDNARGLLPAGALPSVINDDFGDVFGLYYAVSAPGYSDADIWEISTFLRRELLAVDGVANAQLLGLPQEAIFVDLDNRALSTLGVAPGAILDAISTATDIVPTGTAGSDGRDLRIDAPRANDSTADLGSLSLGVNGEVINLLDIATLSRHRVDDPTHIIRHNGRAAFTLGIAGLNSRNIVDVGEAVEARLDSIMPLLPLGVQIDPIYEQHRVVDEAAAGFLVSLVMSVGVVILVLALFMGWRASIVVGGSLLLTVMATFFAMYLFDIKVERISLGALIIAMGMLVDNAIVVAEGMQQKMRQGTSATEAAEIAAGRTGIPLLGATVIGIMAFAGIGLSPDASGEFLFSLFAVIGLSLMLSWVFAVTVTPLLGAYVFKVGGLKEGEDPYSGPVFRAYRGIVRGALRARWLVIVSLLGITAGCIVAFGQVTQQFFPPSDTPLFFLEYKAAQGSSINTTSQDLARIEDWLLERDDVAAVTTSAGQGVTRFLLIYAPQLPEPSYGELVIRASDVDAIPALRRDLDMFVAQHLPWARLMTKQTIYGPSVLADIEARFSGPDPDVLRALAIEAAHILRTATPDLHSETIDWHEREAVIRPIYAEKRAQTIGIARADIATAIALVTDGVPAGVYRERDRLINIIIRSDTAQSASQNALLDQPVWSSATGSYVPLAQAIDGFEVLARDTLIERRDRQPTVTAHANVIAGMTPPTVFAKVRPAIEAILLPEGYALEWGGEFQSAGEAQQSLGRQMPLSFGVMLLITVLLFGKLRQTAVIWTIVPMAVNGVALGLLFTGLPFSFTALLGMLSLTGMVIKNAIVLVEEIDIQKEEGLSQYDAIVEASTSRLRPVVLAAATTILGMVPLLADSFFAAMAVAIMAGLGFASILTLVGVPVLYHTYLRKERREGLLVRKPETDVTQKINNKTPQLHPIAAE
ncbi:RND/MFP-family efflux tansporter RND-component [Octadecabacter antarcticus 307]|uniref:RND/MFP-family efflux tansporter RND-component n=1 Tax=Octadecabacter antarcticus 307 TaxID=391626 RepID=M9R4N9_9RHOB|nr:RND/MFP-family efflux tansporter RND-component [Octadecabacter antarcticus 307]